MSPQDAERIRKSEALEVLTAGLGNINRVVDSPEFGLVIDRHQVAAHTFHDEPGLPSIIPRPFLEHDILHMLNEAEISVAPRILWANRNGQRSIIKYVDGETFSAERFNAEADIREWYIRGSVDALNELSSVPRSMLPGTGDTRRQEWGWGPPRPRSVQHYAQGLINRTDHHLFKLIRRRQKSPASAKVPALRRGSSVPHARSPRRGHR